MKLVSATLLVLLLFTHPVEAKWTKTDTKLQWGYALAHTADWWQTLYIATNANFYETNPILGAHPSVQDVNIYFATTLIGHTLISHALPPKWRRWWQVIWIGIELTVVTHNYNVGVGFGF